MDTTFARIKQPSLSPWEFYNKHKNDYTIQYQVTASLGRPFRILSFEGPYRGAAADVTVFRDTLVPLLKDGEKVMTDKGYWQDSHCWCPPKGDIAGMSVENKIKRRKVTRIRHLNERMIGRLKFWGLFKKRWNYKLDFHELCATVIAVLTQLELLNSSLN